MEILTAYIREECSLNGNNTDNTKKVREYIQAILKIIGRRNVEFDHKKDVLIFSYSNLSSYVFEGTFARAKLSRANLSGAKNLTEAQIESAIIDKNTKLPEAFTEYKNKRLAKQE